MTESAFIMQPILAVTSHYLQRSEKINLPLWKCPGFCVFRALNYHKYLLLSGCIGPWEFVFNSSRGLCYN